MNKKKQKVRDGQPINDIIIPDKWSHETVIERKENQQQ